MWNYNINRSQCYKKKKGKKSRSYNTCCLVHWSTVEHANLNNTAPTLYMVQWNSGYNGLQNATVCGLKCRLSKYFKRRRQSMKCDSQPAPPLPTWSHILITCSPTMTWIRANTLWGMYTIIMTGTGSPAAASPRRGKTQDLCDTLKVACHSPRISTDKMQTAPFSGHWAINF